MGVKVDIVHICKSNYLNESSAEFFIEKIPFGTDINEEGQLIAFLKKEFKDWHARLYDSKGHEMLPLRYNVPFENIEILSCKAHVKGRRRYQSEQDMNITSPFFKFIQDPEKDLKIVSYRIGVRITKKSKKTRNKK